MCMSGQAVLLGAKKAIFASKYTNRLYQLMAKDMCIWIKNETTTPAADENLSAQVGAEKIYLTT